MCLGWMFFNVTFYGLLTWMPTYLFKVHNLDIKSLGGASFIIFFSGFVGELIGGWIGDRWRSSGGSPNLVYRTLFAIAAIMVTISIFLVAYTSNADPWWSCCFPRRCSFCAGAGCIGSFPPRWQAGKKQASSAAA